tara:strand:+ start:306 stop:464 length:159 start_codon:yes stop_codon:yes gene_type:complete
MNKNGKWIGLHYNLLRHVAVPYSPRRPIGEDSTTYDVFLGEEPPGMTVKTLK